MEKQSVFTFPMNYDFESNPDRYSDAIVVDLMRVDYTGQTKLGEGKYTYNTDENAYMNSPTLKNASGYTRGYLRLASMDYIISPGDVIEVEYEARIVGQPSVQPPLGVNIDFMAEELLVGSFEPNKIFTNEYQYEKMTTKVPPKPGINRLRIVIGALTTNPSAQTYTIYIRNVNVTVIRHSGKKITSLSSVGLGVSNLSSSRLIDNATVYPTSQSRDINLKSGVYGIIGLNDGADGVLGGNGMLIVLPYRTTLTGTKLIEQIAVINSVDAGGGIYLRSYNGASETWSKWRKITESSGTTVNRPPDAKVGHNYFDTNLGKPIWLKSKGVWVDATGVTV